MKKFTLFICLFFGLSVVIQAQSKLSYTLLINQSASIDETVDICIFRTDGGQCLSFEPGWKTNVTLNTTYQVNKRIRLQSGIGYNVYSQDKLNEGLATDKFKIKYLSVPVRLHYLITNGKVKFYTGVGIRTDIRLNKDINITEITNLSDTGRKLALSAEGLIGIEIPLATSLKLHFEPTIATALTPYTKEGIIPDVPPNVLIATPEDFISKYPSRIGISLGFTYNF